MIPSSFVFLLLSVIIVVANKHRGKHEKHEKLRGQQEFHHQPSCFSFKSPTYMNQDFFEFSLDSSSTITSYVLHVDTRKASLNRGCLVSWTFYGSVGEKGVAPINADDPALTVVDAQFNVDFSVPEDPHKPDLFIYNISNLFTSNQTYQYVGFVGVLNPPLSTPFSFRFTNPVTQVDFCP